MDCAENSGAKHSGSLCLRIHLIACHSLARVEFANATVAQQAWFGVVGLSQWMVRDLWRASEKCCRSLISTLGGAPHVNNYTSRDPKQLRADGRAQTCQQLVAFCASTRMNQNDAVVNLARVALLHVCCWHASRFSTAPELRLGKRARWRASARA